MYCVYACGSNGRFQLGDGTDDDLNDLKRVFECESRPVKIVCGGNHTLILLENGDLYATGDNTYGQCGIDPATLDDEEKRLKNFTDIPKIDGAKWIDCSAGYEFSIFVNEKQYLFAAGLGPKGELGLGENLKQSTKLSPININLITKIIEIKSCLDHTVLLLENHDVYGWGNGRSGKLGEPAESKIWSPRKLDISATHVEVGRDYTAIADAQGSLKIMGKDKFSISSQVPQSYKDFKSMWSSLHFITSTGEIKSIGNNSHGQMIPDKDVKYDLFEVGSEHGIIADAQKIKSWGWGEHGNCGINKIDSVTFDYINELHEFPNDEIIIMIKGGCATTWVVTQLKL